MVMPSFDTPEPITVTIDTVCGHVRLRASDRADTVVEVRPTDPGSEADRQAAEATQIDYAAGRLSVRAPKNRMQSLFGRYPAIDIEVELPVDSATEVKALTEIRGEGRLGDSVFETGVGNVRVDETGRLKVHTGAGDVWVGRTRGPVEVSTATGKVWIGAVDGTATVKSSNGDITAGTVAGDLRLVTANGDITIEAALASVEARTAAGRIRVGEVTRGSAELKSGFGELELGITAGTAAWLDVSSKHGTVHSDLESIEAPEATEETVRVHARTGYGDIMLRRRTRTAPADDIAPTDHQSR
jgi:hypothetical protein